MIIALENEKGSLWVTDVFTTCVHSYELVTCPARDLCLPSLVLYLV